MSSKSKKRDLVNDAVKFQRVKTSITSTFWLLFSLILLSVGIYMKFIYKQTDTMAKIIEVIDCVERDKKTQTYDCNVVIKYTVNGIEYKNKLLIENSNKSKANDDIRIDYEKNNPNKISKYTDYSKTANWVIIIGLLIFVYVLVNLYLVRKYKSYALMKTAGDVSRIFR